MSPSLDRPRTGKSISVAFALRACVRAKLRERDDSSVAGADPMRFPGGLAGCPAVRPVPGPAVVFRIVNAHKKLYFADPFSLGLLMPTKNYILQTLFFRIVNAY